MSDRFGSIAVNSNNSSPPPETEVKTAQHRPPSPLPPKGRGKTLGFLLIAVLLISSYFWAGLYLAPLLIKKFLPGYVLEETGMELSIDHVQLNPLNFQVTLLGVRAGLPGSAPTEPLLQSQSLFIDLHLTSLLRNDVVCDALTIKGLELNLIRRKDKSYNAPEVRFSGGQEEEEIINFATLPFLFSLNNIDISDGRIFFEDRLTRRSHKVEELQLGIPTLSNFSFQSDNYIQPHFSAVINGSEVQLSGKAVQLAGEQGFQTRLSCSIQSLDLVPYFSYLPATFPFSLTRGRADTSIDIGFSPKRKKGSRLTLDIRMIGTDIQLLGKNNDLQIAIPSLETDTTVSPLNKRLHIKSLLSKGSHLTGSEKAVADTLQRILSYSQHRYNDKVLVSIDQLLEEDGRVTLFPQVKKGEAPGDWEALRLSVRGYQPEHSSGSLHLSGQQKGARGDFSWQAALSQSGSIHGKLQLKEFPAASFFALLSPPPGIEIQGGATFSGDLSFSPSQEDTPGYTLGNGMLQLHKLKIIQGKTSWLTAESVRVTRFNRVGGHTNMGKIFLKEATLKLNSRKMSPLFSQMLQQRTWPRVQDIDFSGTLFLESGTEPQKSMELSDVHWQLRGIDRTAETENFSFTGQLPPEGLIKATGTLNLIPPTLQTSVDISKVDASRLALFFPDWPLLRDNHTLLEGKGSYRFPESTFRGELQLSAASLQDSEGKPVLSWQQAKLSGLHYKFSPPFLQADNLLLDSPHIQWQRNATPPLQELQQAGRKLFTLDSEQEELMPLAIKKISIRNGSVSIVDQRLSPPWQTSGESLTGLINNFNSRGDGLSSLTMSGVMEGAPLNLSGSGSIFRPELEARARLTLTDFPLAAFAKQLAASPLTAEGATLQLQMDLVRDGSRESSKAKMTIKNLESAPKNPDAALALALLKNAQGTFPLSVELDGRKSLFQKSLDSFQTKVIKTSYTPFLLDSRFSDLQDKSFIAFHPGTSSISAAGKETLIRYGELLAEHPGLSLAVTGMADGNRDRQLLQKGLENREQQRVDAENRKREKDFYARQKHPQPEETGNSPGDKGISIEDLKVYTPLLPEAVSVADAELLDLARDRALTAYDFCVHSLAMPADQISIAREGTIGETTPASGVRLGITPLAADGE